MFWLTVSLNNLAGARRPIGSSSVTSEPMWLIVLATDDADESLEMSKWTAGRGVRGNGFLGVKPSAVC